MKYRSHWCLQLERDQSVALSMQRQDAFHFLRRGIESYTHHSPRAIGSIQFNDKVKGGLVQGDVVKDWHDAQSVVFSLAGGFVVAYHHRVLEHPPACLKKQHEFRGYLEFEVNSNRQAYAEGVANAIIKRVKKRFPKAEAI